MIADLAVHEDWPAQASPRRTVRRHRPVPRHGDDLLATAAGGRVGTDRVKVECRREGCTAREPLVNSSPSVGE